MASTKPCSGVYFLLLFLFFNKIEDFVPGMPQLLKPRLSYFYLNLKLKKKKKKKVHIVNQRCCQSKAAADYDGPWALAET